MRMREMVQGRLTCDAPQSRTVVPMLDAVTLYIAFYTILISFSLVVHGLPIKKYHSNHADCLLPHTV